MSTIKANNVTAVDANADLALTGDGTGTVNLPTGFKVNNVVNSFAGLGANTFSGTQSCQAVESTGFTGPLDGVLGGGTPAAATVTTLTTTGLLTGGTIVLAATDTDTSNTGSVTIDFATHQNFVLTLTGNVTLANPTTEAVGQAGVFVFIQDGTGSRTLSLGTDYESPAGAGIVLSTAAAAVDIVPYFVKASGSIQLGAPQLAFA